MTDTRGLVILIHGLWMNGTELSLLRWRLHSAGFRTRRFHYPSMSAGLDDNAREFGEFVAAAGERPLYIVAHSLGGLVTLHALSSRSDLPVARVVFMGAPVRGSSAARGLLRHPWGETMLGKGGSQALAAAREPEWRFAPALGVIAGTQSLGLGQVTAGFDGPNDGTVAVAETALDGAADTVTVDAGHMTMLISAEVAGQVIHFLRHGMFRHGRPA